MIRLITGTLRGRKLDVPPSKITRPTTDRVRESIFNLLESYLAKQDRPFEGLLVLDAFAGSGALGFEALSRGAKHITFFEQAPAALKVLQHNAAHLKLKTSQVKILRIDATKPPKMKVPADLIFIDPPYGKKLVGPTYKALVKAGWVASETSDPKTLFVIETSDQEELPEFLKEAVISQRTYGSTVVSLIEGQIGCPAVIMQ
tara:strand:+ start:1067 stop:1672 length:606 start_codon:yes stop_codon:yes gene_type:complete